MFLIYIDVFFIDTLCNTHLPLHFDLLPTCFLLNGYSIDCIMSHICICDLFLWHILLLNDVHMAQNPMVLGGGALWSKIWRLILHVNHQWFGEGGPHIYLMNCHRLGCWDWKIQNGIQKVWHKGLLFFCSDPIKAFLKYFSWRDWHQGVTKSPWNSFMVPLDHFLMPGLFSRKIDGDESYAPCI